MRSSLFASSLFLLRPAADSSDMVAAVLGVLRVTLLLLSQWAMTLAYCIADSQCSRVSKLDHHL
jgi:hypothetical protein